MTLLAERQPLASLPSGPLRAGEPLDPQSFADLRRRMVLTFCKWDPQVQDVSTLAPFPLLLDRSTWLALARDAERLAAETMAMERALTARPDLHARLGLPPRLRRLLARARPDDYTPPAARVMRFDFHPTPDGWRISEVNSDVPGGFTESSAFTKLFASRFSSAQPAGNPVNAWADAISLHARDNQPVALLSAPGFMEDHQVIAYLARTLAQRDIRAVVANIHHLRFVDGHAHLESAWYTGRLSAIVRFHQGEWLSRLGRRARPRAHWQPLFVHGLTPVCNPGCAILGESKRLPLVWDELNVDVPTWRRLLPETREPRDAPWRRDDAWLIKTAYCNTGDSVAHAGLLPRRKWLTTSLDVLVHRRDWLAQKRFEITPIDTPIGAMYPCLGVYTIDGIACGIYGRISPRPIIAYNAIDAAVLVAPEGATGTGRTRRGEDRP